MESNQNCLFFNQHVFGNRLEPHGQTAYFLISSCGTLHAVPALRVKLRELHGLFHAVPKSRSFRELHGNCMKNGELHENNTCPQKPKKAIKRSSLGA